MTDIADHFAIAEPLSLFSATPGEVRFSYSKPDDALWKRMVVRGIERLTGQPKLERLYRAWSAEDDHTGDHIFKAGLRLMNITVDVNKQGLLKAPTSGPLLIIANHPFGVVDGLAIMDLALRIRPDVKIMVHSLLCKPPEAKEYLLPVDFSGTHAARATSAATRRRTIDWLERGHCVVIFPSGGVATAQEPFTGQATDSAWHAFVARLALVPELKVLPMFFHGQNSRLFQIASHMHYALRIALLFRESARRMGGSIAVTVGAALDASGLPHAQGRKAVVNHLRKVTFALGGQDGENAFVWPKHIRWD